jgi:hypothetical protein
VSALVDAGVVDVSALSRLLSSRRIVVIEDSDQTVLKAIDKSCGSPLYSSKSDKYVLPAEGLGNFRAIADLGEILSNLAKTDFEVTFVQDRDGMPDFLVEKFVTSQQSEGVKVHLLDRHEIENYLLQPPLIAKAGAQVGIVLTEEHVAKTIVAAASELKANARQASHKCAELINRHLKDRLADKELGLAVDKWFDSLDTTDLATIQRVFPGKELLPKVLEILNNGQSKRISRGTLVASISEEHLPEDMVIFLKGKANVVVVKESAAADILPAKAVPRKRRR